MLYTLNRSSGTLDTLGSEMLAHGLVLHSPTLGLPSSEPVGTGASTATPAAGGSQTVTNVPGGVSNRKLRSNSSTATRQVNKTTGFLEIPGRIYITVP